MSWKCPECSFENKDDITRCVCGFEQQWGGELSNLEQFHQESRITDDKADYIRETMVKKSNAIEFDMSRESTFSTKINAGSRGLSITRQRNIFISFVMLSLILAVFGYFVAIDKHWGFKERIFFAYLYWSWVWGLKLVYPHYIRRVQSHRFSLIRWYGYLHYGAFYWCWAMIIGFLGGGIYKFFTDLRTLIRDISLRSSA